MISALEFPGRYKLFQCNLIVYLWKGFETPTPNNQIPAWETIWVIHGNLNNGFDRPSLAMVVIPHFQGDFGILFFVVVADLFLEPFQGIQVRDHLCRFYDRFRLGLKCPNQKEKYRHR